MKKLCKKKTNNKIIIMEDIYEYWLIVLLIAATQLLKKCSNNSKLNSFITTFSLIYLTGTTLIYVLLFAFDEVSVCDFHTTCHEGLNGTIHAYVVSYKTKNECKWLDKIADDFYDHHKNGEVDDNVIFKLDGIDYKGTAQCTDSEYGCCFINTMCDVSVQNEYSYDQYNSSLHEYYHDEGGEDIIFSTVNTKITKYDENGESCPTVPEMFNDYEKREEWRDDLEGFLIGVIYILIIYIPFCCNSKEQEFTKVESGTV